MLTCECPFCGKENEPRYPAEDKFQRFIRGDMEKGTAFHCGNCGNDYYLTLTISVTAKIGEWG